MTQVSDVAPRPLADLEGHQDEPPHKICIFLKKKLLLFLFLHINLVGLGV
jgi:hypothetical protein